MKLTISQPILLMAIVVIGLAATAIVEGAAIRIAHARPRPVVVTSRIDGPIHLRGRSAP